MINQSSVTRHVKDVVGRMTTWRRCEFCKKPGVTMAYGATRYRVFYVCAYHARRMGASGLR